VFGWQGDEIDATDWPLGGDRSFSTGHMRSYVWIGVPTTPTPGPKRLVIKFIDNFGHRYRRALLAARHREHPIPPH
jgi:hypothetical protein